MKDINLMVEYFYRRRPIYEGMIETIIQMDESLINSYSVKKLESTLIKEFGSRLEIVDNTPPFTWVSYTIVINIKNYNENIDKVKLEKILNFFGYHIAHGSLNDSTNPPFTIEPQHTIIMNDLLKDYGINFLYHITPKSKLNKIKKYGLAPRGSETTYYHPDDRIYLIYSSNFINIEAVKRVMAKDKEISSEEMIILRTPFDDNYKYYLDDLTTNRIRDIYAVFVLKNIPSNKLEVLE